MPTYEYVCKACGHEWTVEQRITADPLKECPNCHEPKAQRQISAGNFILKGGGWYADAYSSHSNKVEAKSTPTASTDAAPKADSKESKPADKAPATAPPPPKAPTTPPKDT